MEKELFKLLLNAEWYKANKHKVLKQLFPNDLHGLIDVLNHHFNTDGTGNLSVKDLKALFLANNPGLTRATKENYNILFTSLDEIEVINPDIGNQLLDSLWRKERFRQIGECVVNGLNGENNSFDAIAAIIDDARKSIIPAENVEFTSDDLDYLLDKNDPAGLWHFNLQSLHDVIPGVGPGNLIIQFGRPNVGKSGLWVSSVYGPGGFAEQGATIHAIINEEPAIRTQLRGISAATGRTVDELRGERGAARACFGKIKDKIKLVDDVDMSLERLDAHVRQYHPDIIIVDQLDKLRIEGSYARSDERLKALYVGAREIVKRHNCIMVAVCQASADAEGKRYLDFSMMEGSKTGKAGEGDIIIGIGKPPVNENGEESLVRTLNICKNKINGKHPAIECLIDPMLSRYVA